MEEAKAEKVGPQKRVVMPAFSLMIAGIAALIIIVTLIEGWRLTQGELLVYYWGRWLSALLLIAASVAISAWHHRRQA